MFNENLESCQSLWAEDLSEFSPAYFLENMEELWWRSCSNPESVDNHLLKKTIQNVLIC